MIERTGCSGVSAGRGAFYNPWIFLHTQQFLETGEPTTEPTFEERIRVLRRHYDLMVEVFGEDRGSLQFRKVAPWYSKRFGPVKPFNSAVVRISSRDEFEQVLSDYLEWRKQFTDDSRGTPPPLPVTTHGSLLHGGRRRTPSQPAQSDRRSQRPGRSLVVPSLGSRASWRSACPLRRYP